MPTYRYHCEKCQEDVEKYFFKIQPKEYVVCQKCKNIMIRLVGAGTSINLKGSGWYKKGWQ